MMSTKLDAHAQPASVFNLKANKKKSLLTLKGILEGVVADENLKEIEVLFLNTWLASAEPILDEPDVVDLLDVIQEVVVSNSISAESLQDVQTLISDVLHYNDDMEADDSSINYLLGLLSGIVADGDVNADEFIKLDEWLEDNSHIHDTWPANRLVDEILKIKEDGVVETHELDHLCEVLKSLTGNEFEQTGAAIGSVSDIFADDCDVCLDDAVVCFTGKFIHGPRAHCEKTAVDRGVRVSARMTNSVNYLVLGSMVSRDWKFTSHGRKIEDALNRKEQGQHLQIISEKKWFESIGVTV